jgi:hypothetical protein|tara:strand:- start:309175 stop:309564 length:390 start_codon:yes stop_codon:yes gene_type:complete
MLPKRDLNFIKTDPETPKTQLVIVTGLLVIAAIFQNETFAYVALIIGVLSIAIKPIGDRIVWAWYKLAELLSKVMNPLILGLLYFLFITPIALLFRLFGNDPLRLKDNKGSLFEIRDHTFKKKDLVNPW